MQSLLAAITSFQRDRITDLQTAFWLAQHAFAGGTGPAPDAVTYSVGLTCVVSACLVIFLTTKLSPQLEPVVRYTAQGATALICITLLLSLLISLPVGGCIASLLAHVM